MCAVQYRDGVLTNRTHVLIAATLSVSTVRWMSAS